MHTLALFCLVLGIISVHGIGYGPPTDYVLVIFEALRSQVEDLQDEVKSLRQEVLSLNSTTKALKRHEHQLEEKIQANQEMLTEKIEHATATQTEKIKRAMKLFKKYLTSNRQDMRRIQLALGESVWSTQFDEEIPISDLHEVDTRQRKLDTTSSSDLEQRKHESSPLVKDSKDRQHRTDIKDKRHKRRWWQIFN